MSTKPDYESAARVLRHRMSLPGGVTPDGDIRDIVDAALGGDPTAWAVAALIAEGGEIRQSGVVARGVSAPLEDALHVDEPGRYLVFPIPVESAEAKEAP